MKSPFKIFLLSLFLGIISQNSEARIEPVNFLIEPGLGYKFMYPGPGNGSGGALHGGQFSFRLGLIQENMFIAADGAYYLLKHTQKYDRSYMGWSVGASVGGSTIYFPFRFYVGVYFVDRIFALPELDAHLKGTPAIRLGASIHLSRGSLLNFEFLWHNFDEFITNGDEFSLQNSISYNSMVVSLQFPLEASASKTRRRRR